MFIEEEPEMRLQRSALGLRTKRNVKELRRDICLIETGGQVRNWERTRDGGTEGQRDRGTDEGTALPRKDEVNSLKRMY
jgi:hypothetical protein